MRCLTICEVAQEIFIGERCYIFHLFYSIFFTITHSNNRILNFRGFTLSVDNRSGTAYCMG